jgi:molecular chaperone DnaJ
MSPADDYYALLGVDPRAGASELRRAWRRLALRWHPDRAGSGATAIFQDLERAYAVLSDPAQRAAYDRRRGLTPPSAAPPRAAPTARPAPAVALARLSGPLNALLACGVAEWVDESALDLFLNAQEMAQGGMATIAMRVPVRCSRCAGAACARCGGAGATEELFTAWLSVPPRVAEGTVLAPSELLPGMLHPVTFTVRRRTPPPWAASPEG